MGKGHTMIMKISDYVSYN